MNKEIKIPDGYEARIEGNKVIIEQKESGDEKIRKAIGYAIYAAAHEDGTLINDVTKDKALAYLERQKEQKPVEWSEEDEKMLLSAIEYVQTYPAHRQSVVNWLKSLRPQPHWKPSKVQMEALAWYSGNSGVPPTGDKAIKSLYIDLQKLL